MLAKLIGALTFLRNLILPTDEEIQLAQPTDEEPSPELNPIILTHGPDLTFNNWLNLDTGDIVRINGCEGVIDTIDENGIQAFMAENKEDARRCRYAAAKTDYTWDEIRTLHIV